MNDRTTEADLNEDLNELNKKIVERENSWSIPDRYLLEYDLSPTEALVLTILRNTGRKKGYSEVKLSYLQKYTKHKDRKTTAAVCESLESKGFLYRHYYSSSQGNRYKYVHEDNAGKYWRYLTAIKQFGERKKFEESFMSKIKIDIDPPDPEPGGKNPTNSDPGGKNPHGPRGKNPHAINTTYLSNRENDVTCKGSDEPSAAASSEDLMRIELLYSYSKKEVDLMLQWYQMQTQSKKDSMKKPIACIINAYKGGYAQEEVASANKEVAAQLQKEEKAKLKQVEKEAERETNKKLANQLIQKFSHMKGWTHNLDSKGFSVNNESVEKGEDTENGCSLAYYILPDGKKCYGKNHFLRVTYDLPHAEFKRQLKEFFNEAQWNTEAERQTA